MRLPPKAPPVYKPTPVRLAAPPVYRPQQSVKQDIQLKSANSFRIETRPAPPVYRSAQSVVNRRPQTGTHTSTPHTLESRLPIHRVQPQSQIIWAAAQRSIKSKPASTHQPILRQAALPQLVLQCMQNQDPEVEMKSQFFSEGKLVDLNCGRYCVAAAIKYLREKNNLEVGDPFHELEKPEKTKVGPFNVRIGWSPGYEGQEFAAEIDKPDSLDEWQAKLDQHGPLIVSGKLGQALFLWVGHYILIIGADTARNRLICKDPLRGNDTVKHDFDWIDDRIEHVYRIKKID